METVSFASASADVCANHRHELVIDDQFGKKSALQVIAVGDRQPDWLNRSPDVGSKKWTLLCEALKSIESPKATVECASKIATRSVSSLVT